MWLAKCDRCGVISGNATRPLGELPDGWRCTMVIPAGHVDNGEDCIICKQCAEDEADYKEDEHG